MTTEQLTEILRSTPREVSPREVERRELAHDVEYGLYVSPEMSVHHCGEAAH